MRALGICTSAVRVATTRLSSTTVSSRSTILPTSWLRRRGDRASTRPESAAMLGLATSWRCRATAGTRISNHSTTRLTKIIELGTAGLLPHGAVRREPVSPDKIASRGHGSERRPSAPATTRRRAEVHP